MIKRIVTTALLAGTAALTIAAPAMAAEPPLADAVTSTVADVPQDITGLVPGQAGDDLTDFSGAFNAFTAGNAQQTVSNG
ncbi:hypothetical protein [Streptomyces sp. NBC_01264]|uniref:hypothetical protein n=1 Tax=Streptomyces sp. NBC_01264 TaxID=2903804 RepID=UPI00225B62D0|nr:hypothetical protein [Streptomyces sp. NBC_01264]MCX4783846.1 hypothetical protein [Streptomyces sp. NBC_01264]